MVLIAPTCECPLELIDLRDLMQDVEFTVFSAPAKDPHGRVAALHVPGGCKLSRKEIDAYTKFVGIYGARGLAYIKVNEAPKGRDGLQSPILKFLHRCRGGGHHQAQPVPRMAT